MQFGDNKTPTICWDCAKAVNGCAWSKHGIPVKGWNAERHDIRNSKTDAWTESYSVIECPEFVRDSWGNGAKRL